MVTTTELRTDPGNSMGTRIALAGLMLLLSSAALAQERGDWVLGRWQQGAYWFPGVVEGRAGDHVTIAYDDGTRETLPAHYVRRYDWDLGTHVECQWAGGVDWYPGTITAISRDGVTLHVLYDDGDREQTRTGACRSR